MYFPGASDNSVFKMEKMIVGECAIKKSFSQPEPDAMV